MRIIEGIIIFVFVLDIILCIRDCNRYMKYHYNLKYSVIAKKSVAIIIAIIIYILFPCMYCDESNNLMRCTSCLPPKKFELENILDIEDKKMKKGKKWRK